MKTTAYYIFLFSGIFPALILLILTLAILPSLLTNFELSFSELILLFCCLLGLGGFIGLISLVSYKAKRNALLTALLLFSGVLGSTIFMVIIGGKDALQWIITFEEPDEWFIFMWPNIVAFTFAILLLFKHFRKHSDPIQ